MGGAADRKRRAGWPAVERGARRKGWRGRIPVALVFANSYRVGMSSLGFQLVYEQVNDDDDFVCERFFLDDDMALRSVESGRPLADFPLVFFSISFEQDYPGVAAVLERGGIPLWQRQRRDSPVRPGSPLVVAGGIAMGLNPEPVAGFLDLAVVGEAEALLPSLLAACRVLVAGGPRRDILLDLCRGPGFYVPWFYRPRHDGGVFRGFDKVEAAAPDRVRRVYVDGTGVAGRSCVLSDRAGFRDMHLVELGRGCSRGCRFCAAGFVCRPPRLWDAAAVGRAIAARPPECSRVGLLGMEMAGDDVLSVVAAGLSDSGCSLSFSSLRADAVVDGPLLGLLGTSDLKAATIAPDGPSERLRQVINKNVDRGDVLRAAERLAAAGIPNLKLYFMLGLPTEEDGDVDEMLALVDEVRAVREKVGRGLGRLGRLVVNVSVFVPKPFTPFQFHPMPAAPVVKKRLARVRRGCAAMHNVDFRSDGWRQAAMQAAVARGGRGLAEALARLAGGEGWKQACRRAGVDTDAILYRERRRDEDFPWEIIDHGIRKDYLWAEYRRALAGRPTVACRPLDCRRCGVCGPDETDGDNDD